MIHLSSEDAGAPATFGRRKVKPRVCVADAKRHIRTFLREALEELGFIACECAQNGELGNVPAVVELGMEALPTLSRRLGVLNPQRRATP